MLDIPSLRNRKIILGVCGSIAAYKAVEVLRLLVGEEAKVDVVMSTNATKFIAPLTFEALSGNPVYHQVFNNNSTLLMEHIRVAESADLLLVAPATRMEILLGKFGVITLAGILSAGIDGIKVAEAIALDMLEG